MGNGLDEGGRRLGVQIRAEPYGAPPFVRLWHRDIASAMADFYESIEFAGCRKPQRYPITT
jgi:hypothetical protein